MLGSNDAVVCSRRGPCCRCSLVLAVGGGGCTLIAAAAAVYPVILHVLNDARFSLPQNEDLVICRRLYRLAFAVISTGAIAAAGAAITLAASLPYAPPPTPPATTTTTTTSATAASVTTRSLWESY